MSLNTPKTSWGLSYQLVIIQCEAVEAWLLGLDCLSKHTLPAACSLPPPARRLAQHFSGASGTVKEDPVIAGLRRPPLRHCVISCIMPDCNNVCLAGRRRVGISARISRGKNTVKRKEKTLNCLKDNYSIQTSPIKKIYVWCFCRRWMH